MLDGSGKKGFQIAIDGPAKLSRQICLETWAGEKWWFVSGGCYAR